MVDRRDFLGAADAAGGVLASGLATAAASAPAAAKGSAARGGRTIRAWQVGGQSSLASLQLVTRPAPVAGPGEAVVRVRCSALNARDLAIVGGRFARVKRPTLVPLSDGAGEVVAVGPGVAVVKPGDRVICAHFPAWNDGAWSARNWDYDVGSTLDGWLAEETVLPAQGLVKLPESIAWETACTLPVAGATAWHALYGIARVKPGDVVLTLGTGGVSTWGLRLARASGAQVIVTSSSDEKIARLRELGAFAGVNYRTNPAWGRAVVEATGGHGADVVLENVGRATLDESMSAAASSGRIVMIGTGPLPQQLPRMPFLYEKNLALQAISNASRRMLADLVEAVAANGLQPVIGKIFAFGAAKDAFELMAKAGHAGKIVIRHA